MNAIDWQQLERIFAEARRLAAAERGAFVHRECDGNSDLCAEVLTLLSADEDSGGFLHQSALAELARDFSASAPKVGPGSVIGAYTIVDLLGTGGSGQVWRARDQRLNREVAIKLLLPHWSGDPERIERFAEEARAAGALNDPHILTVYDVGEHGRTPYLITEYLQGQNLRARLAGGSLSWAAAIGIALGAARGLAAAHERGLVHRDLKPENLFLGPSGAVKLLDFGLAKLLPAAGASDKVPGNPLAGTLVGTAAYMAPEQIRGEAVDGRADLFALGVILYEMLGGVHPFRGASTLETLQSILTLEPPELSAVNSRIPPQVAEVVTRLMQKRPAARFQSAADLAWTLQQALQIDKRVTAPLQESARAERRWLAAGLAAAALATVAWIWQHRSRESAGSAPASFIWQLPAGMSFASAPVVSPDGRRIAFIGADASGQRLYVRDLKGLQSNSVTGTDRAEQPFWSVDGQSIGYFSDGRLMKVRWPGGAPGVLTPTFAGVGATWNAAGDMVYSPDLILAGLLRVPAGGGAPTPVTQLVERSGDNSHRWPVFLPDGEHFLYYNRSSNDDRRGVWLGDIHAAVGQTDTFLFRSDCNAIFVPNAGQRTGELLYVVKGRVVGRSIDLATLTVSSDVRDLDLVAGGSTTGLPALLGASPDVLALIRTTVPDGMRMEAVARDGKRLRLWPTPERQNWPRISPDGTRIARQRLDALRGRAAIWIEDLASGALMRTTPGAAPDKVPTWSPDGRRIAYAAGSLPGRPGVHSLRIASADGSGEIRSIPCPRAYCEPSDWSPDGRELLVTTYEADNLDVWLITLDEPVVSRPLLNADYIESDARFAPNGRWVAYVTQESGRPEIALRSLSANAQRAVVTSEGGAQPVWRRDGQELYYVDPKGNFYGVPVHWSSDGTPKFDKPQRLNIPSAVSDIGALNTMCRPTVRCFTSCGTTPTRHRLKRRSFSAGVPV